DLDLQRDCAAHRPARVGARRGGRLRRQRHRGGDPLPSRGAPRRQPRRLSLGRRAQARAAGEGGGGVTRLRAARSGGQGKDDPAPLAPVRRPLGEGGARIASLDWARIAADLDAHGCAVIGPLLGADDCADLAACYDDDTLFRSRIVMARHGFGRGEYKYFAYPLPDAVAGLRSALYSPLAQIANCVVAWIS